MMSGHGANPIFFNNEKKIGRPEDLLTLQPLHPKTYHFCLDPHPSQSGRYICITPIFIFQNLFTEYFFSFYHHLIFDYLSKAMLQIPNARCSMF